MIIQLPKLNMPLLAEYSPMTTKDQIVAFADLVWDAAITSERERCAAIARNTICATIGNVTVWGHSVAVAILGEQTP